MYIIVSLFAAALACIPGAIARKTKREQPEGYAVNFGAIFLQTIFAMMTLFGVMLMRSAGRYED